MATQSQLEETFRAYGISGSTLRKAIGFFLAAARYTDVTVSPHFKLPKRTPDTGRARPVAKAKARAALEEAPVAPPPAPKEDVLAELDPFIVGLVRRLPPADSVFPQAKQEAWFDTARGIFKLIYKTDAPDDPEPRVPRGDSD